MPWDRKSHLEGAIDLWYGAVLESAIDLVGLSLISANFHQYFDRFQDF
jgi:hypothetical protein